MELRRKIAATAGAQSTNISYTDSERAKWIAQNSAIQNSELSDKHKDQIAELW